MVRRVLVLAVVVALGSGLAMAPPAAAARPVERGHYSGTDSFVDDSCGTPVIFDVSFSGVYSIRPARGSGGQAFFAHDNYEFTAVGRLADDDPTTNEYVVAHGNGVFHEQHATPRPDLGPYVYEFEAIDAGMFTLRDSAGKLLIRDRGVVKLTAIFDTEGDGQPGGILISEEAVFHGPHSDDAAFCAALLGALT